ncbi:hypothetical protein FM037_02235 [Shewanella psychropiezotolerans]|uniref:Uncharacterized protein n=1 Tax=Shewanella psychropiezotolerans TaxID=2593655 RepID=A0ABX5WX58_9GAMM|nr:hypothetical protein [Shewanella psychropiezotolerans]QDO82273.1 hypothetical protein FM037_02235 [Shewanella psychropiezotolerans]
MKYAHLLSFTLAASLLSTMPVTAQGNQLDDNPSQTYRVGVMVEEISDALTKPNDTESLATISQYGTDSRYYVMIRGWLVQELAGVQSQLDASQTNESNSENKQKFIDKVTFLQRAIRRIDLE